MPLEPKINILLSSLLAPKRAQEVQMLLFLSGFQCHYALNPPKKPPRTPKKPLFGAKALVMLVNIKSVIEISDRLSGKSELPAIQPGIYLKRLRFWQH